MKIKTLPVLNNHNRDMIPPVPPETIQEFVAWIKGQVEHLNGAINTAQQDRNFGREAQYQGMRDAFIRCLNKLTNQQYWN